MLIMSASGGVGTFAVQIAKAFGAVVTGVCSTAKLDLRPRAIGLSVPRGVSARRSDDSDELPPTSRISRTAAARPEDSGATAGRRTVGVRASAARREHPKERYADLERLVDLIEAAKLTPTIERTYSLHHAPDAMRHLHAGHARGNLVITVADGA